MCQRRLSLGWVAVASGALFACSTEATSVEQVPASASQSIIDGTPANDAKFDAVGAIVIKAARYGYRQFKCSGTLIAPQVVLTARHCTQEVALGQFPDVNAFFVFGASADKPEQKVQIKAFINAPAPSPTSGLMGNGGRDLALLYLDKAPKGIVPAKLGSFDAAMLGSQFEIAGYGATNYGLLGLKFAGNVTARALSGDWYHLLFNDDWAAYDEFYWTDSVSSWDPDEEVEWWEPGKWELDPGYELLAGGLPGESVGCFGDSGGPLLRGNSAADLEIYGVSFAVESSLNQGCGYGGAYVVLNGEMLEFVQQGLAQAPAILGN